MSTDSSIVHVNTLKGTAQTLLHKDCQPLHTVGCHPKQPCVAMGNGRGVLKVWDYNNKVIICSRVFETETNIQCVTFDPQGEPVCLLTFSAPAWICHYLFWSKVLLFSSLNRIIPGSRLWQWSCSHTEFQHFTKWCRWVFPLHQRQHPSNHFLLRLKVSCHCGKQALFDYQV